MDADRTRQGVLGALLGAVGGYFLAYWQGRKIRRALALLRVIQSRADAQVERDMKTRLDALGEKRQT